MNSWCESRGSYGGLGVFEGLDGVVGLLHVKRLLHELVSLTLVPGRPNPTLRLAHADRLDLSISLATFP